MANIKLPPFFFFYLFKNGCSAIGLGIHPRVGYLCIIDILVHTIMLLHSRGSTMGFLDPSVVYSFFPLDDIFILIEGFFVVVLVVFKEAQRGIFVYI
jgi:hypothetical protein